MNNTEIVILVFLVVVIGGRIMLELFRASNITSEILKDIKKRENEYRNR